MSPTSEPNAVLLTESLNCNLTMSKLLLTAKKEPQPGKREGAGQLEEDGDKHNC